MIVNAIATNRYSNNWPSWHIVHEWEDVLSTMLQVPIRPYKLQNKFRKKITDVSSFYITRHLPSKLVNMFYKSITDNGYYLVFELTQQLTYTLSVTTHRNAIPVIIDFFCHSSKLHLFYNAYKNCKLILISSLEAYCFLKKNNCPLPIQHFPLSLSDRYKPDIEKPKAIIKTIDILIAGRTNPILADSFQTFIKKFPAVDYVYRTSQKGHFFYLSSKNGNIGNYEDRKDFISLLNKSKIAFYTTPGIDGGEIRTAGFNPVTPRFLELLNARCHLIGRYPDNEETRFYELSSVCKNVSSYEVFEIEMLKALNANPPDECIYNRILEKHYTSKRAELLQQILEQI